MSLGCKSVLGFIKFVYIILRRGGGSREIDEIVLFRCDYVGLGYVVLFWDKVWK